MHNFGDHFFFVLKQWKQFVNLTHLCCGSYFKSLIILQELDFNLQLNLHMLQGSLFEGLSVYKISH